MGKNKYVQINIIMHIGLVGYQFLETELCCLEA